MPNRLAGAVSLYLRQHAENPVDWYPWSDEAFDLAKQLDRPVFLSVGYSSCHWCHVMAHECFEDIEVAEALNRSFVSIKLDREERPDIDEAFMTAVQMATGRGGWPMSVFMTPDKEPFFAGTYFPKSGHGDHPGFLQIVQGLATAWHEQRDAVMESAGGFASALRQSGERSLPPTSQEISPSLLDDAVQAMHESYDHANGGFGAAPKFPQFTVIRFLQKYSRHRRSLGSVGHETEVLVEQAAAMARGSLTAIVCGGIHDHVGGGIHRYSVDEHWHVPHFEKMLYDNAQFVGCCSESEQPILIDSGSAAVEWIVRDLSSPDGSLYSSLDADTGGEEGATYTWSSGEIHKVLGSDAQVVCDTYNITPEGNFLDEATQQRTGTNIPYLSSPGRRLPQLDKLLEVRANRPQPATDDKSIAAWNGLAISAFARAGFVEEALRVANAWASFGTKLPHLLANGQPHGTAFLDDVAAIGLGYLDLAQATKDDQWKDHAMQLADQMVRDYGSDKFLFQVTHKAHGQLFAPQRSFMDSALPSATAMAISLLRKLGRLDESLSFLAASYSWAERAPLACAALLTECLHHQIVQGGAISHHFGSVPRPTIALESAVVSVDASGAGTTRLLVTVPVGFHINTVDPATSWLVGTGLDVTGAYAEAGFPAPEDERYEGQFDIELKLRPISPETDSFTVVLQAQVCSDTECYTPVSVSVSGEFFRP